jgi:hypothetical protein
MEEFLTPPGELLDMDQSDLETLLRALEDFPHPTHLSVPAGRKKTKRR